MPRKSNKVVKREIPPDAKYGSVIVSKFINKLMLRGQKATAERVVYDALLLTSGRADGSPVEVLEQAVKNVTPALMVKSRRIGGATYQVPVEVEENRGRSIAMRWLISAARARHGNSMAEKLAAELTDAVRDQGAAIKKRSDVYRMAEANRAFVHYRW
ncbi:MAG: 30S ribosomal protein S7 [Chloroflexi bacterium CG_4_10_14_0_8_um_filter_46_9]|jgi:small subunit ribosomal protein S7|nr:MAG: 30S ribosomal protein S7 [Dehalococcoidia bacterium CG2_30_46_19]PIW39591.1 MAG: 30S ribosomal protein S7 [Chloroflexi bacterium CG15_BIG_FIL_POST_REV_8_21_14_020_46_15]PIZ27128.1 MAG: 30S ribosomal protein S7 [Chloroflexi bacterium CG_4_10_14_0_8_um_filter_46_9]